MTIADIRSPSQTAQICRWTRDVNAIAAIVSPFEAVSEDDAVCLPPTAAVIWSRWQNVFEMYRRSVCLTPVQAQLPVIADLEILLPSRVCEIDHTPSVVGWYFNLDPRGLISERPQSWEASTCCQLAVLLTTTLRQIRSSRRGVSFGPGGGGSLPSTTHASPPLLPCAFTRGTDVGRQDLSILPGANQITLVAP